ncbi:MAG: hypothetical protein ACLUYS_02160 [Allobaculum sp.]|uniref:hypothetical protein n=1 Tax=Allobaculum sp. TaxID=1872463 RepID=UPI00399BCE21
MYWNERLSFPKKAGEKFCRHKDEKKTWNCLPVQSRTAKRLGFFCIPFCSSFSVPSFISFLLFLSYFFRLLRKDALYSASAFSYGLSSLAGRDSGFVLPQDGPGFLWALLPLAFPAFSGFFVAFGSF